jgi:hypothetical protein
VKKFVFGFKKGFKEFGENIGLIVNSILLSAVYFIGVGPTYLVAKIVGKKFLDTKTDKKAKTYWSTLDLDKKTIEEYYRQF